MEANQPQLSDRLLKQFNSSFDFKRLLGTLVSNWYWFVLSLSITITAGFLYLRYTTPKFQILSSILIDENQNNIAKNVLSKIDPEKDKSQVNLFNEKVILQSQDLIAKVIDSLGLNVRYWAIGRVKETEIFYECPIKIVFDTAGFTGAVTELHIKQANPGQFEIKYNDITERILSDTWVRKPYGRFKIVYTNGPRVNRGYLQETEFIVKIQNTEAAIKEILGSFKVNINDGRTSLLDLLYTDNMPQRGVDFLNVLIYFYQKRELENINLTAEKTRQFINEKKASMMEELKSIDSMTVDVKLNNDLIDPAAQTGALLTEKSNAEKTMNDLYLKKQAVSNLKNSMLTGSGSRSQVIAGVGIDDPYLSTLVNQYNVLVSRKEELERNTGPSNPVLIENKNEISACRKRIIDAANNIDRNLSITLDNAAKNAQEFTSRIRATPEVDRNLKDITRNYGTLQSIYLFLYQKGVENDISVYSATNKSKIVVVPVALGTPISPVPNTIYLMMVLLGLLVPGATLIIRELMNNKVINENDIESLTSIPVIGTISRVESATNRENTIVVGPHIRTGVAEQFRLIRANLEFMTAASNNRIYMITSSSSGEGKSFISINLGITMTLARKRVVVMEFDLRKPKISQYLGIPNDGGISGYLAGMCSLEDTIKASGIHENLYIANCGPIPPNPGELLVSTKTQELLEELRERFDVVIIDTAPIGLVSDALILSQYAGVNLFIIRQSYTVKDQIRMFDVLHKDGKIQNPAIIFNGVEFLKKYGYGYGYGGGTGYGYAYGYGYGYGYYDEQKSRKTSGKNILTRFFTK